MNHMRRLLGWPAAVLSLAAFGGEVKLTESQVPRPALDAVRHKYPAAKVLGYEKETEGGKTVFEAKLTVGDQRIDVELSAEGRILAEETVVAADALPAAVKAGLEKSAYAKWSLSKVERIVENEDAAHPTYEVQLKNGAARMEVVLDATGAVIKAEKLRSER